MWLSLNLRRGPWLSLTCRRCQRRRIQDCTAFDGSQRLRTSRQSSCDGGCTRLPRYWQCFPRLSRTGGLTHPCIRGWRGHCHMLRDACWRCGRTRSRMRWRCPTERGYVHRNGSRQGSNTASHRAGACAARDSCTPRPRRFQPIGVVAIQGCATPGHTKREHGLLWNAHRRRRPHGPAAAACASGGRRSFFARSTGADEGERECGGAAARGSRGQRFPVTFAALALVPVAPCAACLAVLHSVVSEQLQACVRTIDVEESEVQVCSQQGAHT